VKESFLHFVWQFQKFDKTNLTDSDGNEVKIFEVGEHNTDAGPDFINAKIKVAEMEWHGQVEIHIAASAWNQHGHQKDAGYNNVILHVVWDNDEPIRHKDGKKIPTIELKNRVSKELLLHSNALLNNPNNIPCSNLFRQVNPIQILGMQEKTAIERLESKYSLIFELLKNNATDWEETTFQLLAKNYGFKINAHPFLKLAKNLPFKTLKKHCGNSIQIEALIFGISGFLNEAPKDDYHAQLMNEYVFLAKKYNLEGNEINKAEWKYLRLRPANFPTVRLSQFAALLNESPRLFDVFTSYESPKKLISQLMVKPSKYWIECFDFGKKLKNKSQGIGVGSIENILINTTAPLLAAYSKHTGDQLLMDKAVSLLQHLKPEKNNIITQWNELNIEVKSAFESQAMIELYNNYCLKKRCLSCNIGVNIINKS